MSKTCINHRDVPFVTLCHQCHHPICKACSLVTPQGIFCSSECSVLHREVKARLGDERRRPASGFFTQAAAAFVLLVVGFTGIHIAASNGVSRLRRIDVIGLILERVANRQEGTTK